jgi:hypothetical protein
VKNCANHRHYALWWRANVLNAMNTAQHTEQLPLWDDDAA